MLGAWFTLGAGVEVDQPRGRAGVGRGAAPVPRVSRVGAGAGAGCAPAGVVYRRIKMISGVTVWEPTGVMHARHLSQAPRA